MTSTGQWRISYRNATQKRRDNSLQTPGLQRFTRTIGVAADSVIRVNVKFEDGVPDDIQAKCLFDFEVALRRSSGMDVWVLKDRMADDSRLRVITDMRRERK